MAALQEDADVSSDNQENLKTTRKYFGEPIRSRSTESKKPASDSPVQLTRVNTGHQSISTNLDADKKCSNKIK